MIQKPQKYESVFAGWLLLLLASIALTAAAVSCEITNEILQGIENLIPGVERIASLTTYSCQTKSMHSAFWLIYPIAIVCAQIFSPPSRNKVHYAGVIILALIVAIYSAFLFGGVDKPGTGKFSRMLSEGLGSNYLANLLLLITPMILWFVIAAALKTRRV